MTDEAKTRQRGYINEALKGWSAWFCAYALVSAAVLRGSVGLAFAGVVLFAVIIGVRFGLELAGWVSAIVLNCGPALNEFVTGLGSKLAGKVSPELNAAVKAINQAHENDKANDLRITSLEGQLSALKLARGLSETRRGEDIVSDLVNG